MNLHINYYNTLGLLNSVTDKEIKKSYYDLSKYMHPDKGGLEEDFILIAEAYKILSNQDSKKEYDKKSKYGKDYNENDLSVLFNNYSFKSDVENYDKNQYEEWRGREELNILVYVDENFDGTVEYQRWITCKTCGGSGKDVVSKIAIKDINGNIRYFDAVDGCDMCEGTGKWGEDNCFFCSGAGKINAKTCDTCKGGKRILGKQKLSGIKIKPDDKDHRVEFMGNVPEIYLGRLVIYGF